MQNRSKLICAAITALLVLSVACGEKQPEKVSMLVIFASGEVSLSKAGTETPVKTGMLVSAGDTVITKEGTVDLQTRAGTAIRLRSNSRVTVEEIAGNSQGKNRMALTQGSVFARAQKQSQAEEFQVATPTAIAGVRGTSFSVTVDEKGQRPNVRVMDGKVAFAPRPKGKAADKLPEVVLEEKTTATLPAGVEKKMLAGDTDVNADALKSKRFTPTAEERLDKATLIVVEPKDFDSAAKGSLESLNELAKKRDELQDEALSEIRREAAIRRLDNQEELKQYYSKVVTVRTKDGQTYTGAVISRSGARIIMHANSRGIITLNNSDIASVQ